jgi:hypothetical protein
LRRGYYFCTCAEFSGCGTGSDSDAEINLIMLIAAHVLSLEAILVTDNVREFARIPDLRFENWLAETDVS